jgi:hypothetical protein
MPTSRSAISDTSRWCPGRLLLTAPEMPRSSSMTRQRCSGQPRWLEMAPPSAPPPSDSDPVRLPLAVLDTLTQRLLGLQMPRHVRSVGIGGAGSLYCAPPGRVSIGARTRPRDDSGEMVGSHSGSLVAPRSAAGRRKTSWPITRRLAGAGNCFQIWRRARAVRIRLGRPDLGAIRRGRALVSDSASRKPPDRPCEARAERRSGVHRQPGHTAVGQPRPMREQRWTVTVDLRRRARRSQESTTSKPSSPRSEVGWACCCPA